MGKARVIDFRGQPTTNGIPTWNIYLQPGKEQEERVGGRAQELRSSPRPPDRASGAQSPRVTPRPFLRDPIDDIGRILMNAALDAALGYARRGWPVFPMSARKVPVTEHGLLDATIDEATIAGWCHKHPATVFAIATGEPSGIVALDADIREGGSGLDSLELLGINFHPATPTAHTPSGGIHCLFAWPGYEVPCSAGKLGRFLDVRGDGGALILPPGPGRWWDPHLGLDIPVAPLPSWMVIDEPAASAGAAIVAPHR